MIAMAEMRGGAVLILLAGAVLPLSNRGWSQTAPVTPPAASTNVEEWQATDLSMLDFVADGYDLVSVISPSSHARIYFLSKPGKIVKCREEESPNNPPPTPPPLPTPGQGGTFIPPPATPGRVGTFIPPPSVPGRAGTVISPADSVAATSVRTEFECAVLSHRASRQ
jgi:hypothetical protein